MISNYWYAFFNLLYPQYCLVCDYKLKANEPRLLCEACTGKINADATSGCVKSDGEGFAFERAFYAATYDDTIKRCVRLFKYEGKIQMADLLGELMADFANKNIDADEIDLIVPVPLHPLRLRERQFNQSEALATYLAKRLNKTLVKDKVKRIKYTTPQTELKREERLKNVNDAFLADANKFKDKTILLIDDVLTTGATLHECSKALKSTGAKRVIAFALARGN